MATALEMAYERESELYERLTLITEQRDRLLLENERLRNALIEDVQAHPRRYVEAGS